MQVQQYETVASLEEAFRLLTQYEELIGNLSNSEDKAILTLSLQECKTYVINQFIAVTKEKAVSIQDKGKILGFLKPILKDYASGTAVNQVIYEKLN